MHRVPLLFALVATLVVLGGPAAAQQPSPPPGWSVTDCQTCHDKAVGPAFSRSSHGKLDQSCAGCHANVAEHAKAQMAGDANGPVPSLKHLSTQELNNTCLSCHEKNGQTSWLSGMHARRNVACTSCHGVHEYKSVKAQLKTERDPDTCYTCHKSNRAKSMRTSHHPVREGKMACSSCHNPHEGNVPNMLKADSVNDLCYNCHFTGSGHFGSGDNLNTEKGVPVAPTGAPSGYPTVNSRFIERACRTCHVKLHGSNHPSGAFFVR